MSSLKILSLGYNLLDRIPDSICALSSLEYFACTLRCIRALLAMNYTEFLLFFSLSDPHNDVRGPSPMPASLVGLCAPHNRDLFVGVPHLPDLAGIHVAADVIITSEVNFYSDSVCWCDGVCHRMISSASTVCCFCTIICCTRTFYFDAY